MHDVLNAPCACTSVRKASRAISRFYDTALAGTGLTITQFAILRNLQRQPEPPLSRLAEVMVMDRTSLYRMLRPMADAGWVEIVAAAQGRAKIVRITPGGVEACAAATPLWQDAQSRFIGALGVGPDAWSALNRALVTAATTAEGLLP